MLSDACHRFRRRFEPGNGDPGPGGDPCRRGVRDSHRQTCPSCDAYARLVETLLLAGCRRSLPTGLGLRLQRIAELRPALPGALPALPLPAALGARLERIGVPGRSAVPETVRHAGYGVAASYLLVVALGLHFGSPYRVGLDLTQEVGGRAELAWGQVELLGADVWSSITRSRVAARSEVHQRADRIIDYGKTLLDRFAELGRDLTQPPPPADERTE